jgi:DNA-binding transcriptional regulator YhcF (GntR family)
MARPAKTGQIATDVEQPRGRPRGRFAFQLELDVHGAEGDDCAELPMFLRIARAVARDARSGRLPKGSQLPGSRELATTLRVHRNTVLAAYRELTAEGFIQSTHGKGTFIAAELPRSSRGAFKRPAPRRNKIARGRASRSRAGRRCSTRRSRAARSSCTAAFRIRAWCHAKRSAARTGAACARASTI